MDDTNPHVTEHQLRPVASPELRERKIVFLLCVLAAIHVFIFSAAFPFFNNVDEPTHFDLVVKYSHGDMPRALEPLSAESAQYLVLYSSLAYFGRPDFFPNGQFPPPPWTQPIENIRQYLVENEADWKKVTNYESSHPPLYYALTGMWWRIGQWCGLEGGHLLYWIRFFNIPLVAMLVWMGYAAARMIFPQQPLVRLGVPALLAFMPQTVFYSIDNDVLSPLCFGAVFICLVNFLKMETPGVRLGAFTGLALAGTYLTKTVNLPMLGISAVVLFLRIFNLAKAGRLRAALPALAMLLFCAGVPAGLWMAWCERHFGDLTGSRPIFTYWHTAWGITTKPFSEWWHHPIFTPHGLWTFISDLLSKFWQGEFWWHDRPMTFPILGDIYCIFTIGSIAMAVFALCSQRVSLTVLQRQALWFSFFCFAGSSAFWGFESILYDYHDCPNPTPEYPYFSTGRYLLGLLIPFMVLLTFGIDRVLSGIKNNWGRPFAIIGIILFMLTFEIITAWPAFSNPYNWFHM